VACAAGTTGGYRGALAALDDTIARLTGARLAATAARIDRGDPLPMHEFDLIHGLTGLGAYHLHRHPDHHLTHDVLAYLVRITEPQHGTTGDPKRPAWWLAGGLDGQPSPDEFPYGHGNLGMAHGIAGVLALLAHAVLRGVTVPGAAEAIGRLCTWLDQWRQPTADGGAWWPGYLTIDNLRSGTVQPTQQPRPSWCYGLSGVTRARQLAGLALADTARQHDAETAMLTALRTADHRALEPEIGLCHGIAGMVHVAWRMAVDAATPQLAAELPTLAADLVARLSGPITNPELMDGAAGAALALHTVGTGTVPASRWDAFLLLG
jgi:class I lanthipeptide synthase